MAFSLLLLLPFPLALILPLLWYRHRIKTLVTHFIPIPLLLFLWLFDNIIIICGWSHTLIFPWRLKCSLILCPFRYLCSALVKCMQLEIGLLHRFRSHLAFEVRGLFKLVCFVDTSIRCTTWSASGNKDCWDCYILYICKAYMRDLQGDWSALAHPRGGNKKLIPVNRLIWRIRFPSFSLVKTWWYL